MAREIADVVATELIQAAWGNDIRDRAVMRYADQAALDAAVPAPEVGETVALTATQVLQFWDGSAWVILAELAKTVPAAGGTFTGGITVEGALVAETGGNQLQLMSTNAATYDRFQINVNNDAVVMRVGVDADLVNMFTLNRLSSQITFRDAGNAIVQQLTGGVWRMQPVWDNTSSNPANTRVNSNGDMRQSTSSIEYKSSVKSIKLADAERVIGQLRGVEFRSKAKADDSKMLRYGFIQEEVAEVVPTEMGDYDPRSILAYVLRVVQGLMEERDHA